jgi:hypothetical protein
VNRISCAQFEESVHDLVRLDLLDPDMRDAAFAHARICAGCAARLDEAQTLAETTFVLREENCAEETPLYLEAGLIKEFREQHRRSRSQRQLVNISVLVAAAACFALAGWFSYARWLRPGAPASPVTNVAHTTPSTLKSETANAGIASLASPQTAAVDNDQLANFVPVPFADESTPDDPGVIVRVQVTRAALAKLGYQVEKGKGKELVNADFLVGEDGWPRAVRLEQ